MLIIILLEFFNPYTKSVLWKDRLTQDFAKLKASCSIGISKEAKWYILHTHHPSCYPCSSKVWTLNNNHHDNMEQIVLKLLMTEPNYASTGPFTYFDPTFQSIIKGDFNSTLPKQTTQIQKHIKTIKFLAPSQSTQRINAHK